MYTAECRGNAIDRKNHSPRNKRLNVMPRTAAILKSTRGHISNVVRHCFDNIYIELVGHFPDEYSRFLINSVRA